MHGDHKKLKIALRYWLQGKGFYRALKAMEIAENLHTGTRKDKKTPEFAHQVWIANFVRTLTPGLLFPEESIACGLLHDAHEDYLFPHAEAERLLGREIADSMIRISKVRDGTKINDPKYYAEMAACPIASIVKPIDRSHNLGSMVGVFEQSKQVSYIGETHDLVMPSLKRARRRFPEQELAYENIKQILLTRIALIEAMHAAAA